MKASLRRVPLLARLAARYSVRHKAQTARAVLGLLVATTVLAAGLGMGESIAVSLEERALAQLGPVDVILTAERPFQASVAERAGEAADARAQGASGASTLGVVGPVSNPRTGLAEAFATIRGVSPREAQTLGPLRGAPEPGPGEVVLSETLASRLDARVGDRVVLRAPPANLDGFRPETVNLTGLAGPTGSLQPHALPVREDALGLGAGVSWLVDAGTVRIEATSPSGVTFANESADRFVLLLVEPPVEAGTWTLRVFAQRPVAYAGQAGVQYVPESLTAGFATLEARVAGIAEEHGRAAVTGRPAALVPLADLQAALDAPGQANLAYWRVAGDPYRAVDAIKAALPAGNESGFNVRAEKAERIRDAEEAGAEITGFLLVMGGFTLLAAILLAFTLFSALVEERRAELGIARALGLTRGEVAFSMTLEGALYAFVAALAGLLLGLAILALLLPAIGSFAASEGGPRFAMRVSPGTIALSFLIGVLIPLATIGGASLRFARLDPARAIRGIPDDPKGTRRWGLVLAALLALLGLALSLLGPAWRLVGVPLLAAGAAVALNSLKRPLLALLATALGFAHVAWSLYAFTAFPEDAGELDPITTLARGAVLALGASALAVASARPWLALLRAFSRGKEGPRRSTFVALKYLLARRRPVGLTMGMVSLVVVVVTVMGTLFSVFSQNIPTDEAGYTILGEAPLRADGFPRPLPPDVADDVERADFLPRHIGFRQANASRDGEPLEFRFGLRQFLGVTPGFAEANRYELAQRAPQFATDRAAWDAVAQGEAIAFPDWVLEENDVRIGDRLLIEPPGLSPKEYVVAAAVRSQFAFQTYLAADDVRAMGFPLGAQAYVRVREGADPNVLAHRLTDLYDEDGLTFTSIPEEVDRIGTALQALVLVFEAFLALGLFVGLAATGFLASRAVHERMRDIGTLRALGFEESDVRRAFVLESTLTTGGGLVLGTLVGLLVAHSIWWREIRGEGIPFTPPWLIMAFFAVAVLGLAAWSSNGPAKRAARLPPAIAVRYSE